MKIKTKIPIFKRPSYIDEYSKMHFLIVCPGPTSITYLNKITPYLRVCISIGCNYTPIICYYNLFVNRKRFLSHGKEVDPTCYLLSPYFTKTQIKSTIKNREYQEIMFNPKTEKTFEIDGNNIIHAKNASAGIVAIGVAIVMGAQKIFIAGMDGYNKDDGQQQWYNETDSKKIEDLIAQQKMMQLQLDIIKGKYLSNIEFITPTVFK